MARKERGRLALKMTASGSQVVDKAEQTSKRYSKLESLLLETERDLNSPKSDLVAAGGAWSLDNVLETPFADDDEEIVRWQRTAPRVFLLSACAKIYSSLTMIDSSSTKIDSRLKEDSLLGVHWTDRSRDGQGGSRLVTP